LVFIWDEFDYLLQRGMFNKVQNYNEKIEIYYKFWKEVFSITENGHMQIITGRDPTIYNIGQGLYRHLGQKSPPSCHANEVLILDPLKINHIEEFLIEGKKYHANRVYEITLGVPRLVYWTTKYVNASDFLPKNNIQIENLINSIMGTSGTCYTYPEIYPYFELAKELQSDYQYFIKLAYHEIPFNITKNNTASITSERNGFLTSNIIDLIKYYNIYVKFIDDSNTMVKVILPEIVKCGMKQTRFCVDLISFYEEYEFLIKSSYANEQLPCFSIIQKLRYTSHIKFKNILPELSGNFLKHINIPTGLKHLRCPKLVKDSKLKTYKRDKNNKLNHKVITKYLTEIKDVKSTEIFVLHKDYWLDIRNEVVKEYPYAFFTVCEMSASSDFFIIFPNNCELHVQAKSKQKITLGLIKKEVKKLKTSPEINYTLVITSLTVSYDIDLTKVSKYSNLIGALGELSLLLEPGCSFTTPKGKKFQLDTNVECIILYQKGMQQLLEAPNEQLLHKISEESIPFVRNESQEMFTNLIDLPTPEILSTRITSPVTSPLTVATPHPSIPKYSTKHKLDSKRDTNVAPTKKQRQSKK